MQNEGYAESHTASLYGRETYYEPAMSRAYSPSPSQANMMMYPPPGYQSGRNTPMSVGGFGSGIVHQPMPSRPASNYLDVQIPSTRSPEEMEYQGGPSDAEIDRAVADILRDADLTTVTKREIRRKLEEQFGMDLTPRKRVINDAIDRVLLSHAA